MAERDLDLRLVIRADGSTAVDELGDIERAAGDLGDAGREAGREVSDGLVEIPDIAGDIQSSLKGVVSSLAALASVEGIKALTGYLYEAGARAQDLRSRLEFVAGGSAGADQKMRDLAATAGDLGQRVGDVVGAYASLGVVTDSVAETEAVMRTLTATAKDNGQSVAGVVEAYIRLKNLGLDPSRGAIEAYMNVAAASGKTLEDFIEAVADAATGEFERLKEFGIKASVEGDQVAVRFRGQTRLIENDAAAIEKALQSIGQVEFAGAVKAQADNAAPAMDLLSDAVDRLAGQLAIDSGLMDGAKSLADGLTRVADAMLNVQGSAGATAQATSRVGEVFGWLTNPIGSAVGGLDGAGKVAETLLGKLAGLIEKLSDTGQTAEQAEPPLKSLAQIMAEIGPKAADSATRIADLDAKLKALGVSVEQLNAPTLSVADAFDALVRSSDVNGDGLVRGLEAALKRVSEGELPRVTQAWEAAKVAGQITADQYAAGMAQIQAKLASLPAAISPLESAFKDLGVTSQASLDAAATKARAAFDVIASGQVPLARLQEAFNAYAQAAIAANGGVVPEALRAEAAQRGLRLEVEKVADATKRAATAANGKASADAKSAQSAQQSAEEAAKQAAEWGKVTAAHVTYGEWVSKSGAAAAQQATEQQALAVAAGEAGDRVHALAQALKEAENYNAKFSPEFDAAGAEDLQRQLEEAKATYEALSAELQAKAPTVAVEVDASQVEGVKKEVDALDGTVTYSDHSVASNVDAVASEIQSLAGQDTSSTHTIYIKKVEQNALGGLVGLAQRFNAGGGVFRRPGWSVVPGVGNEDTVPAALPSGSYVLRQAASRYYGPLLARLNRGGLVNTLLTPGERWFSPGTVNRHGAGLFAALNRMEIPRAQLAAALDGLMAPVARFNAGGAVGSASTASPGPVETVNIQLQVGARTVQLSGPRDQANALAGALRELQRSL